MRSYEANGEWEIVGTSVQRDEFHFECCPTELFSYISFSVALRRRHEFYVMNVLLPGVLTSALLLSIFYCIPSQKVHIGVAALLSWRIFLVNVSDTVPRTSDHIPLLGQYRPPGRNRTKTARNYIDGHFGKAYAMQGGWCRKIIMPRDLSVDSRRLSVSPSVRLPCLKLS